MKQGEPDFESEGWTHVAPEAKDLVQKLLKIDPNERIEITDIMAHPWFEKIATINKAASINPRSIQLMRNIRSFNSDIRLQQACLSFIQVNLVSTLEQEQLSKVFTALDKNSDGVLTRDELVEGLTKMGFTDPADEADRILETADANENGTIEFTEFCTAAIDKQTILQKPRLHAAFDMFDKNKSGKISFEELKQMLQGSQGYTDDKFTELIKQIDIDGDNKINFDEFERMIKILMSMNEIQAVAENKEQAAVVTENN